jgi:hypothetical protein
MRLPLRDRAIARADRCAIAIARAARVPCAPRICLGEKVPTASARATKAGATRKRAGSTTKRGSTASGGGAGRWLLGNVARERGAPEGSPRPVACAADPPRGGHKHSDRAALRGERTIARY